MEELKNVLVDSEKQSGGVMEDHKEEFDRFTRIMQ